MEQYNNLPQRVKQGQTDGKSDLHTDDLDVSLSYDAHEGADESRLSVTSTDEAVEDVHHRHGVQPNRRQS